MAGTKSSLDDDIPSATVARRSSRARTSVKRLQDEEEPQQKKPTQKKIIVNKRKPQKKIWEAEDIVTDPKSPLATADLRALLSNPLAWDSLDREEQEEVLALLPDSEYILGAGTKDACPNLEAMRNDDTFRHECASYTQNIAEGRFDPGWLSDAYTAQERRKTGDFDDYLEWNFETTWDTKLPEDFKIKRPQSTPMAGELSDSAVQKTATDETLSENRQHPDTEEGERSEQPQQTERPPETDPDEAPFTTRNGGAKRKATPLQDAEDMQVDELQVANDTEHMYPDTEDMPLSKRPRSINMNLDAPDVLD